MQEDEKSIPIGHRREPARYMILGKQRHISNEIHSPDTSIYKAEQQTTARRKRERLHSCKE